MSKRDPHGDYDKYVEPLFVFLDKQCVGKQGLALATVLYGGWASVNLDWVKFEEYHEVLSPYEAAACRAMADVIMFRNGKQPLSDKELRELYNA